MDFITAGVSIVAVLLCMAVAMLGIWQVDRKQAAGAQVAAKPDSALAAPNPLTNNNR